MLLQAAPAVRAEAQSDLDLDALLGQDQPKEPVASETQPPPAAVSQQRTAADASQEQEVSAATVPQQEEGLQQVQ